jgi:hypothetical protein
MMKIGKVPNALRASPRLSMVRIRDWESFREFAKSNGLPNAKSAVMMKKALMHAAYL